MSQDNQNQDPQDDRQNQDQTPTSPSQGDNWQGDQSSDDLTRETRSAGESDSEPPNQVGSSRPDSSPELEDTDEMDDEDRDDDSRADGSPNRRNNIG